MRRILATLTIFSISLIASPSHGGDDPNFVIKCAEYRSSISEWHAAAERIQHDITMNIDVTESYKRHLTAIDAPMVAGSAVMKLFLEAGRMYSEGRNVALTSSAKAIKAALDALGMADMAKQSLLADREGLPDDVWRKVFGDAVFVQVFAFDAWRSIRTAHLEHLYASMCR